MRQRIRIRGKKLQVSSQEKLPQQKDHQPTQYQENICPDLVEPVDMQMRERHPTEPIRLKEELFDPMFQMQQLHL